MDSRSVKPRRTRPTATLEGPRAPPYQGPTKRSSLPLRSPRKRDWQGGRSLQLGLPVSKSGVGGQQLARRKRLASKPAGRSSQAGLWPSATACIAASPRRQAGSLEHPVYAPEAASGWPGAWILYPTVRASNRLPVRGFLPAGQRGSPEQAATAATAPSAKMTARAMTQLEAIARSS